MKNPDFALRSAYLVLQMMQAYPNDQNHRDNFEYYLRMKVKEKNWADVDKILETIDLTKCSAAAIDILLKYTSRHVKHLTKREAVVERLKNFSRGSFVYLQNSIRSVHEARPKGKKRVSFAEYFEHLEAHEYTKYLPIQCRAYLYCKYYMERQQPESLLIFIRSKFAKKRSRSWQYTEGTKYKFVMYFNKKIANDIYFILHKDGSIKPLEDNVLHNKMKKIVKEFLT